jgi:rhodanese-related sulfurtransferase
MLGWFSRRSAGRDLAPEEAKALADSGEAVLVDVREEGEWQSGHIPGAVHLPLSRLATDSGRLPKGRRLVLYCLSGARSARALAECARLGLPADSHVAGGISAWRRAGLPVTR